MTNENAVRSRFSVCQNVLGNADMTSDLDIVSSAGIGAIAIMAPMLSNAGVDVTRHLLSERSLRVSSYLTGIHLLPLDVDRAESALRGSINIAHQLNAPIAVVGSGPLDGRTAAQADEHVVTCLRRVGGLADDKGVRLAIEPIHPLLHSLGYIHTLGHAAEIVEQVHGARVALDLVHTFWDRHIDDDIAEFAPLVCSVHLSDLDQAALDEKRWQRAPLGSGVVPVAALVRSLVRHGFNGTFEDEILIPAQREQSIANLRTAQAWLEDLWETLP